MHAVVGLREVVVQGSRQFNTNFNSSIFNHELGLHLTAITVVDNQSPQIGYLGGNLMNRRDFFGIELQISKDVEKGPSEVYPTSN